MFLMGLQGPMRRMIIRIQSPFMERQKLAADNWLKNYHGKNSILRANVVYDYTNRTKASFLKWIVESLIAKKPIKVVNDQWNNPTWTYSITKIINLEVGKIQTIQVSVKKLNFPRIRNLPNKIICEDNTGKIDIVYFNSSEGYLRKLVDTGN